MPNKPCPWSFEIDCPEHSNCLICVADWAKGKNKKDAVMNNAELITRLKEIRDELLSNGHKEPKTGRFIIISILCRPISLLNSLIKEIENG